MARAAAAACRAQGQCLALDNVQARAVIVDFDLRDAVDAGPRRAIAEPPYGAGNNRERGDRSGFRGRVPGT